MSTLLLLLALLAPADSMAGNPNSPRQIAYFCTFSEDKNHKLDQKAFEINVLLPSNDLKQSTKEGIVTDDPASFLNGAQFSEYRFEVTKTGERISFLTPGLPNGSVMLVFQSEEDKGFYAVLGHAVTRQPRVGKCSVQSIERDWFANMTKLKNEQPK